MELCDHSTELSDDTFLQQYPADLPPGMLLLCKTVPWMDGWSLGFAEATDHCSSMQNLEQALSKCFAVNISECSCGFVQSGIADPLLKQL